MPTQHNDPFSTVEEVQAFVEHLVPDPVVRLKALSLFADSADYLHSCGPAKWGAYCDPRSRDRIRLLGGVFIVLTINRKGLWLSLDKETIDASQSLEHALEGACGWRRDDGRTPDGYPTYVRVPSTNIYYVPGDEHDRSWPAIVDLHFAFLDRVARKYAALGARSQRKHQPALLAYLRRVLGRELPDPVYPSDDGSASSHKREHASAPSLLDVAVTTFEPPNEFDSSGIDDARLRIMASIVRRQGQPRFRRELLKIYDGRCAFSGCSLTSILDAAHILPYRGVVTNDLQNGLLLRTDLHTLFDVHLLTVNPTDMTIIIAPALQGTEYAHLAGTKVRPPSDPARRPSVYALNAHRRTFDAAHSRSAKGRTDGGRSR